MCELRAYSTKERRKMRDDRLTAAELTQFRGILGAANWLIASTRPDIAAVGGMLQQRVGQACVSDLLEANRLVSLIKGHAQMSVTYHSIPIESGVFLLATDASWANAQNLRSGRPCDHVRRSWPGGREVGQSQPSTMAILQAGAAHAEHVGIGAHESVKRDRRVRLDAVYAGRGMERRLCPVREKFRVVVTVDNKPIYDHTHGDGISWYGETSGARTWCCAGWTPSRCLRTAPPR